MTTPSWFFGPRRWLGCLAAGIAVSLLAASCGGTPAQSAPTTGGGSTTVATSTTLSSAPRPPGGFTDCTIGSGRDAWCGRVAVPEDWSQPGGPQASVVVAVVPARSGTPEADPVFYLAGYGGSAIDDADWAATTFVELNRNRDLVFVDQRGTGQSRPLSCFEPELDVVDAAPEAIRAAVESCLAGGVDPRHLTTTAAVEDLERARQQLGYDTIDLYGGSYGVSMGLAYLQRYGDHVRAAVLDSGSLLDTRLWELGPLSAQHAFDEMASRCAATPACAAAYQPADDLATVVAALSAHPAEVDVDLGNGTSRHVTITLPMFLGMLIDRFLDKPETAVMLPAVLQGLARSGWAQLLQEHADEIDAELGPNRRVSLQTVTLRCSDEWAAMDPSRISQQPVTTFTPLFALEARWQGALCAAWPHDQGVSGTVTTNAPVVFLNGTADPADPPANVADSAATMPNSLVAAVPGGGHGNVTTGCILDRSQQFLAAGEPPDEAAWAACMNTLADRLPAFPDATEGAGGLGW